MRRITGDKTPYAEIAAHLAMSEGAVKIAVHRLRERYRDLIRAEIAETVETRLPRWTMNCAISSPRSADEFPGRREPPHVTAFTSFNGPFLRKI